MSSKIRPPSIIQTRVISCPRCGVVFLIGPDKCPSCRRQLPSDLCINPIQDGMKVFCGTVAHDTANLPRHERHWVSPLEKKSRYFEALKVLEECKYRIWLATFTLSVGDWIVFDDRYKTPIIIRKGERSKEYMLRKAR